MKKDLTLLILFLLCLALIHADPSITQEYPLSYSDLSNKRAKNQPIQGCFPAAPPINNVQPTII